MEHVLLHLIVVFYDPGGRSSRSRAFCVREEKRYLGGCGALKDEAVDERLGVVGDENSVLLSRGGRGRLLCSIAVVLRVPSGV